MIVMVSVLSHDAYCRHMRERVEWLRVAAAFLVLLNCFPSLFVFFVAIRSD